MTSDQIFKILGNKIRLRVLALLAERPLRVSELTEITGMAMSVVSKDLMRLRAKKLVSAERRGIFITYSLAKNPDTGTLRAILESAKSAFPQEVIEDSARLKSFVPEILPQTSVPAEEFTGNKILPREPKVAATEHGNAHVGELPTNLL